VKMMPAAVDWISSRTMVWKWKSQRR